MIIIVFVIAIISAGHNSMPPSQGSLSPATSAPPTGPDGVPLHDETSQQSTLSQSSDRSDGRQTPKAGPNFIPGPAPPPGYPTPGSPHSSAPSPGGSLGSSAGGHEGGYPRDIASPNWQQRTPASPISAPQQVTFEFLSCREYWVAFYGKG